MEVQPVANHIPKAPEEQSKASFLLGRRRQPPDVLICGASFEHNNNGTGSGSGLASAGNGTPESFKSLPVQPREAVAASCSTEPCSNLELQQRSLTSPASNIDDVDFDDDAVFCHEDEELASVSDFSSKHRQLQLDDAEVADMRRRLEQEIIAINISAPDGSANGDAMRDSISCNLDNAHHYLSVPGHGGAGAYRSGSFGGFPISRTVSLLSVSDAGTSFIDTRDLDDASCQTRVAATETTSLDESFTLASPILRTRPSSQSDFVVPAESGTTDGGPKSSSGPRRHAHSHHHPHHHSHGQNQAQGQGHKLANGTFRSIPAAATTDDTPTRRKDNGQQATLHHARSVPTVPRCDSGKQLIRGSKSGSPDATGKNSAYAIRRDDSLTQVVCASEDQSSADFELDSMHDFDPTGNVQVIVSSEDSDDVLNPLCNNNPTHTGSNDTLDGPGPGPGTGSGPQSPTLSSMRSATSLPPLAVPATPSNGAFSMGAGLSVPGTRGKARSLSVHVGAGPLDEGGAISEEENGMLLARANQRRRSHSFQNQPSSEGQLKSGLRYVDGQLQPPKGAHVCFNENCCTDTAKYNNCSRYGSVELMPEELRWDSETPPLDGSTWSFGEDYENVTLMYAKHEKIPMKDFGSEVRASMDVDHLLNKAVLLLDLPETSLEEIFGKIIHEMDIQEPEFTSEQVKNALFTQDSGNQFHILSRTVQSICTTNMTGGGFDYDQTWICALCMLPTVAHRHVAIARLTHPTNLGRTMQDLRFIIIVIAPSRAKGTKTALETSRTFATLFADMDIRQRLVTAQGVDNFRQMLLQAAKELAVEQSQWRERKFSLHLSDAKEQLLGPNKWYVGRGLKDDLTRRLRYYVSDYKDGVAEKKSVQKLFSTVVFLYFACLLPSIAFGVLNDDNTSGAIGVKKAIFAQAIGGLFFSIFGGQPMIIVLTTAPLALYIKILYKISEDFHLDFFAMYACVGLWCAFFLVLYASTELSSIMKWATRSAEDIFSLFIALAFVVEAFKSLNLNFRQFYHAPECEKRGIDIVNNGTPGNATGGIGVGVKLNGSTAAALFAPISHQVALQLKDLCQRENSILYILLMFGTLWLGLFLFNFRKTPYLTRAKREILADFSLPMSVVVMSFTGAFCFRDVQIVHFNYDARSLIVSVPRIDTLPLAAIIAGMGLGFCLSLLFFIDQNITSAIVNNSQNKLKKGSATHLDMFVVALLNTVLSLMGLPWMHGSLPHSPLHLRALADVEERVSQGHVHEVITNVRETRLASIIAHSLIGLSAIFMLPYPLAYIPRAVLDGLFLYMAVTSVNGNEMFERVLLLATEQAAYPPTHYIRRVPQRKVHLFTVCQLLQLMLLCAFGFTPYPYIEMVFPMIIFFFLPIRHVLIPKVIEYKYLDALDGRH